MGVRDFGGLERGRSPLWILNHPRYHGSAWKVLLGISNHPRFHGSAWKVPALDIEPSTISRFSAEGPARNIEPSTISWFSVEGPRSGYRTIHDITVQRGRSCSEYRTIHDFMVQRGRSTLWISNHPRFHGSAWKVPALDIEPSTISRFSVESPRPEAVTKRAERANGGARAACFEQPEGVYSGCVDARPGK